MGNTEKKEYLQKLLENYEKRDYSFPKEYLTRKEIEDYRYLSRMNEIAKKKLSEMIEFLETDKIPEDDYSEIIRISDLVKDEVVKEVELQIIEAQTYYLKSEHSK